SLGQPPLAVASPPQAERTWLSEARAVGRRLLRPAPPSPPQSTTNGSSDPEMQMNYYNLSEIFFMLSRMHVQRMRIELTDHGGALGAFLFFSRPSPISP